MHLPHSCSCVWWYGLLFGAINEFGNLYRLALNFRAEVVSFPLFCGLGFAR